MGNHKWIAKISPVFGESVHAIASRLTLILTPFMDFLPPPEEFLHGGWRTVQCMLRLKPRRLRMLASPLQGVDHLHGDSGRIYQALRASCMQIG